MWDETSSKVRNYRIFEKVSRRPCGRPRQEGKPALGPGWGPRSLPGGAQAVGTQARTSRHPCCFPVPSPTPGPAVSPRGPQRRWGDPPPVLDSSADIAGTP